MRAIDSDSLLMTPTGTLSVNSQNTVQLRGKAISYAEEL